MTPDSQLAAPSQSRFAPAITQVGQAALQALSAGGSSDLVLAVLLSDDGFEVCRYPATPSDGRYASMASSVQALGEAVLHELKIGSGDAVIIQGAEGYVIQMRVSGFPLVVSAQFRARETLGKALAALRVAVQGLEASLAPHRSALTG